MPRVQATYRARIAFPATRSNPPAQQIAAATCLSPAMHRVGRRLPLPTKKTQNPQTRLNLAWHYKKYQQEQSLEDQRLYADAENKARAERLGLWRENNPNPPWEYRRLYR